MYIPFYSKKGNLQTIKHMRALLLFYCQSLTRSPGHATGHVSKGSEMLFYTSPLLLLIHLSFSYTSPSSPTPLLFLIILLLHLFPGSQSSLAMMTRCPPCPAVVVTAAPPHLSELPTPGHPSPFRLLVLSSLCYWVICPCSLSCTLEPSHLQPHNVSRTVWHNCSHYCRLPPRPSLCVCLSVCPLLVFMLFAVDLTVCTLACALHSAEFTVKMCSTSLLMSMTTTMMVMNVVFIFYHILMIYRSISYYMSADLSIF